MTQDEVLELFRREASTMPLQPGPAGDTIVALARLLAESCGRLSKENFESLVHIGAVLYKSGLAQYNARQDVADIMHDSSGKTESR